MYRCIEYYKANVMKLVTLLRAIGPYSLNVKSFEDPSWLVPLLPFLVSNYFLLSWIR